MQNIAAETSPEPGHAVPSPGCYAETRIGAFGFSAATCTEPLWSGSADAQRACGDSWRGVTEDLFLFTQEDPIASVMWRYSYVENEPVSAKDPSGEVVFRLKPTEYVPMDREEAHLVCGRTGVYGCTGGRFNSGCACGCSGSRYTLRAMLSAAPIVRFTSNHKTVSAGTIIREENKHVEIIRQRLGLAVVAAEALEQFPYPTLKACEEACEMWTKNLTLAYRLGNGYIHRTNPHPGASAIWGYFDELRDGWGIPLL